MPTRSAPTTSCSRIRASRSIVDRDSLGYIDGTEVDFVKQGLNEAFRFRNPNVKGECGCGEIVHV